MEELQKQLVRIFGENTVVNNAEGEGELGPLRVSKESVDLITLMKEKPATPIQRQRTLEKYMNTSGGGLVDILEQTHESQNVAQQNTGDHFEQQLANNKYSSRAA
jgi:hypothetical protein